MRAKWAKVILLATVILLLTSCWDARDIEERDIVTLVIVDKTQDGYSFFVEYAKPSSGGTQGGPPLFAYGQAEGSTLVEAREALDQKSDNPIYLGAANAVVLTEKLAYYSIEEYMYRLREITDYRKTITILVTAESPESFSEILSEQTGVGMIIESTMKSLVDSGLMYEYNLADILESLAGSCKCFLLPNVSISNNDIQISGFSVFNSGKCIGSIPKENNRGVLLLMVDNPRFYYTVPYEGGQATVRIEKRKKDIRPLYSEGRICFTISYSVQAELSNTSTSMTVSDEEEIEITENLKKMIAKDIGDAVQASLWEYQSDYFEFFNIFRIAYPVEYRNMNWLQEYPKAEMVIQVTADLDTTGTLDYVPRND